LCSVRFGHCVFVAKRDVAGWPFLGGSRERPEQFLSIARTDYPVQQLSILFAQRSLAAQSSCCFQKEQVPMDQQSCHSSQLWLESAVQLRCPVASVSIQYALDDGSVADEVCYWRDMTLVPHLLNLFFKREIDRAALSLL